MIKFPVDSGIRNVRSTVDNSSAGSGSRLQTRSLGRHHFRSRTHRIKARESLSLVQSQLMIGFGNAKPQIQYAAVVGTSHQGCITVANSWAGISQEGVAWVAPRCSWRLLLSLVSCQAHAQRTGAANGIGKRTFQTHASGEFIRS